MYNIFFFFLLQTTFLFCASKDIKPQNSTRTVFDAEPFQEAGANIIQNFICTQPNTMTALNLIHELMTQRDQSYAQLCTAIGRDTKILKRFLRDKYN